MLLNAHVSKYTTSYKKVILTVYSSSSVSAYKNEFIPSLRYLLQSIQRAVYDDDDDDDDEDDNYEDDDDDDCYH